jgi:choline-glycine betaine transporter
LNILEKSRTEFIAMAVFLNLSSSYLWMFILTIFAIIGIVYNIYTKLTCGKFKDKNVSILNFILILVTC